MHYTGYGEDEDMWVALDDLSPQTAESFWGTVEGTGDRKKGLQ